MQNSSMSNFNFSYEFILSLSLNFKLVLSLTDYLFVPLIFIKETVIGVITRRNHECCRFTDIRQTFWFIWETGFTNSFCDDICVLLWICHICYSWHWTLKWLSFRNERSTCVPLQYIVHVHVFMELIIFWTCIGRQSLWCHTTVIIDLDVWM